MRYTDKIINQNMKLLASLLLLGLIGFAVPTFAEPIVSSEGDVMTTILLTPSRKDLFIKLSIVSLAS